MPTFEGSKQGFLGLLICIVSFLLIFPFYQDIAYSRIIFNLFFTAILIFSILPFLKKEESLKIACILALPILLVSWGKTFSPYLWLFFPGIEDLFLIIFFGYILFILLLGIVRATKITTNLIFGSICIYLLIGLQWAFIYSLLENIYPGSFQSDFNDFSTAGGLPEQLSIRFFYFSYTTLSTLGYGDITPVTPPAQMISAMEALAGQFYLAVLVARLVGLYLVGAKIARVTTDRQDNKTRNDQ